MQQFPNELAQLLASLVEAYNTRRASILRVKSHQLTEKELEILLFLKPRNQDVMMKEVGDACHIKLSTLTQKVDLLEGLRLVKRTQDKKDRRVIYLSLTRGGMQLMQQLESIWESTVQEILSSHSSDQANLLVQALQSAIDSLSSSE